jgi:rSAM-associated Gly-rich repeat protein
MGQRETTVGLLGFLLALTSIAAPEAGASTQPAASPDANGLEGRLHRLTDTLRANEGYLQVAPTTDAVYVGYTFLNSAPSFRNSTGGWLNRVYGWPNVGSFYNSGIHFLNNAPSFYNAYHGWPNRVHGWFNQGGFRNGGGFVNGGFRNGGQFRNGGGFRNGGEFRNGGGGGFYNR